MSLNDITPARSLITLLGVQQYARAADGLVVTPVIGKAGITEALMGSDGATAAEFPALIKPRGFSYDGGDQINLGDVGSFAGPSAVDRPFSCAAWAQYSSTATVRYLWRRGTTINVDLEWYLAIDPASQLCIVRTFDPAGSDYIGRSAPLPRGIGQGVVATYDASEVNGGFRIYDRSGRIDSANASAGAYEGMVDNSGDLTVGATLQGSLSTPMLFDFVLSEPEAATLCWRLDYMYGITS